MPNILKKNTCIGGEWYSAGDEIDDKMVKKFNIAPRCFRGKEDEESVEDSGPFVRTSTEQAPEPMVPEPKQVESMAPEHSTAPPPEPDIDSGLVNLKKAELIELAESHGIELDSSASKDQIVEVLAAAEVTADEPES